MAPVPIVRSQNGPSLASILALFSSLPHFVTGWSSLHLEQACWNLQFLPNLQSPLNLLYLKHISGWAARCRLLPAIHPRFLTSLAGHDAAVWSVDWQLVHQFSLFLFCPKAQSVDGGVHLCPCLALLSRHLLPE